MAALTAVPFFAQQSSSQTQKDEVALRAAIEKETVQGDLKGAIEQYKKLAQSSNKSVAARALVRMGQSYEKLGNSDARKAYEQVLTLFGDQKEAVDQARGRLAVLHAPEAPRTKQTARLIWNNAVGGTFSPSGRYYTFVDPATGDMAIRDLSAGTNRRLTNVQRPWSAYAAESVVSPDDRQVAYIFYDDPNKVVELRVASIAAGEPARTTVIPRTDQDDYRSPVAWMPDGKQLLVVRSLPDGIAQIGSLTIQDGSFRNIKSFPKWSYPEHVSLSPDGRYVAYDVPTVENGSPHDIFVLATDGGAQERVVQDPANDSFPLWSPDGSKLVFLSDRTGDTALWVVPVKDGRANGPAALINTDVTNVGVITRSGTLYYFSRSGGSPTNLYTAQLDALRVTRPPVPATQRLINRNFGSTWSRDGEYLAYYSFRGDSIKLLVIRSTKTGEERTVPLPVRVVTRFSAGPKWFPDNRSVLVEVADAEGPGCGFYRLALDTGNIELLTRLSRNVSSYDLSPDGRTIFYAGELLIRFDIDTRRETELRNVPDGLPVVSIAVSPDGLQLATTLIGGVVELRPSTTGQPRELFRPPDTIGTSWLRQALTWTPDQRYLLFVRGTGVLWKVPVLGGPAEEVGIPMKNIKNLAVRPDGTEIVFDGSTGGSIGQVWALENLLP
jgi:Tol biopolymer transport system component